MDSETPSESPEGESAAKDETGEENEGDNVEFQISPEYLSQLVDKVKNITTLFNLKKEDWTVEVTDVIEQFLLSDTEPVMSIYYDENTLNAMFGFPDLEIDDLMYFMRDEDNTRPTLENFHEVITFGTIDSMIDGTSLLVIKNVYAPIFYNMKSWPGSVKSDFCTNLNELLDVLTNLRYKMAGLTVAYVPLEALTLTVEAASRDKQLVKRLEGVVVNWIRRIRVALEDKEQRSPLDMLCPMDEFEFWKYRYENLYGVNSQMNNEQLAFIADILRTTQSTYIKQFMLFVDEIHENLMEAKSNMTFLQVLQDPCRELEKVTQPWEIPPLLPKIFFFFKFIWTKSPFYNTTDKLTNLCTLLSNHIIILCQRAVKLNIVFEGKTRAAIKMFNNCIDCCIHYKDIYYKVVEMHNKRLEKLWSLDSSIVFNKVDTFVQRCRDMVSICEAMIIFGRFDETIDTPKPTFGLTRGAEFEKVCDKIEQRFKESLKSIEKVQDSILDVQTTSWYGDILRFQKEMNEIEVIVENLLTEAFSTVNNMEDGLDILQSMYQYAKRSNLHAAFEKRTIQVHNMFCDEIHEARKDLVDEEFLVYKGLPRYAGRAMVAQLKKERMQTLNLMIKEAEWLIYCPISLEIRSQYDKLMVSIDETVDSHHRHWHSSIEHSLTHRLTRPLLCRSPHKPGFLEVNIDRKLLKIMNEANYFMQIGRQLPFQVEDLMSSQKKILRLYRYVEIVTLDYNHVLCSLSDQERVLFKMLIKSIDKQVQPGLTKLTWVSDMSQVYIQDCITQIESLQEFLEDYKNCNVEIVKICEKICDTPMIDITATDGYELEHLGNLIKKFRNNVIKQLVNHYNNIFKFIVIMFEGFELHIQQMRYHWVLFMGKLDSLIEQALRLCVKRSLDNMLTLLRGQGSTGLTSLIKTSVALRNRLIIFTPTLVQVFVMLRNILPDMVIGLQVIPRLFDKFRLATRVKRIPFAAVIVRDSDCMKLQKAIELEMSIALSKVKEYLGMWNTYREIWETDKDLFISRYEKRNPKAEDFDSDIGKYRMFADTISIMPSTMSVHFLQVDSFTLKDDILKHCDKWQYLFIHLLTKMTANSIESIYMYTTENGKRATQEPKTLKELVEFLAYFKVLKTEVEEKESEFPAIQNQLEVLLKYHEDDVPPILIAREKGLEENWRIYVELLSIAEEMLLCSQNSFKAGLMDSAEVLKQDAQKLFQDFLAQGPFTSAWSATGALVFLASVDEKLTVLKQREDQLREDLEIFNISLRPTPEIVKLENDLRSLELVWQLTDQWDKAWEGYKTGLFWEIKTEDMETTAQTLFRKLTSLVRQLRDKNWEIVEHSRKRVDNFRRVLPLITDLKNTAMRERHWDRVRTAIQSDFDQHSAEFTLELIIFMKMQDFADQISEISNAATMELQIENGLLNIKAIWKDMMLDMVPHKDKGIYRLKGVDEIFQALEENQVTLSAMKATRYVAPFAAEVDYWERALSLIMEVVEGVLNVQRQFIYLENIFTGEDIRKQMPKESFDFDRISWSWRDITSRMFKDGSAYVATHYPGMLNTLNTMNDKLEVIQRELEKYLETKRHIFPRFYFISNDDLLEILGNSKKPEMVQPHFKKCFDNINKIKMQKNAAVNRMDGLGMFSADGEYIEFNEYVALEGPVEKWLCVIEDMMRLTLRDQLKIVRVALKKSLAKRDKWIKEWPGQLCVTSSQMQWTTDCTRTLCHCKILEKKQPLKKLKKKQNVVLNKFSDAVRSNLTKIQRLKVVAIVTIEIHARDVIERMYKANCMDVSAFEWLAQLRFYWDRDIDDCIVRQTNTHFIYGYEYLGNSGRLVITPLTDRCYITLTTALNLNRGGSPKGPAGTGKTETVKDLGKGLAYYVIVINCSEGLDYKSMGRMFSGLAQTGAWGCFDEFNRINIEVLSVVAQQILSILSALAAKLKRFVFEGADISLVHTCGIFITMNPGYAGRTELPDNLKSMFRPISMMVPDSMLIAEITLFGEGFRDTRNLAKKVYTLFSLARQQLSKQDHYDFGLRGMVALLRYAGKKRRQHPTMADDEVVLLAMRDMNVAKLTSDDLPLFNGITGDLFPGIELPTIDYDIFIEAITKELQLLKLQALPISINKVIQLYETKGSRHSVMIVGASGAAKSTTWKILKASMTQLKNNGVAGYEAVYDFPLNPKALNLGELYGEFNLATNEWSDGVLSSVMRKTCADEGPEEKWIVFDGPVDAVWIENMNSVMDDNKVLTLINSERITMPEQVSLLFEVEDLAVASPATVSRCGMVFNDYKDFGWHPFVDSWLQKQTVKEYKKAMKEHFYRFVSDLLYFKRHNCIETVPTPELCLVMALCKLLDCLSQDPSAGLTSDLASSDPDGYQFLAKLWFLFCLIWSVSSVVNEEGRPKIDTFIREIEGVFPLKDTVYEYYVDVKNRCFANWEGRLSDSWKYDKELPFFKINVPTVDTVRYEYILSQLMLRSYPVLLVGVVGTGKTSTAQSVISSLGTEKYSVLAMNMSAQTSSNNVQEMIESKVEKRTKGVYVPVGGKIMITFMDDMNMPKKEVYGAQPPLELIRQWIDYGFWYDRQKQTTKFIKDMLLVGAMGPPGGGRNNVSNRLLSRFCIINMTFPAESQIVRIYGTMLSQHIQNFDETISTISEELTAMTIDLYFNVVGKMLPTPAKTHYLFNLRDISKVFQGLLRGNTENQTTKHAFLRLWVHECFRVFNDRLIDETDRDWFMTQLGTQLGKHFDLTFHNVCPSKVSPIFCDFTNAYSLYEDMSDAARLRSIVEKQLDEYNMAPGIVRMELVLFKDAVEHICRVARVISQPRGHILLVGIGGSGRQSVARVAAWLCTYNTFMIEVARNYAVTEFKEDLKKLYFSTGVKDTPTSFLFNDTQVADESFLEILNNILSTGEVTNLYKAEEFDEIKNSLFDACKKAGVMPTTEAIYGFFIERVRSNLHITMCMSPVGDEFRIRLRQYPSLINFTTIDWFLEWPREALLEVANKFLQSVDMLATITGAPPAEDPREFGMTRQDKLRESVATIFSIIHDSVSKCSKRMLTEMKRNNYVTPVNYLELVAGYKEMLAEKRTEVANSANKLRNGLSKIDDTRVKVEEMSVELEKATVQVNIMNQECDQFMVAIVNQKREADDQSKSVAARSIRIGEEEVACKKLAEVALADLEEAMPALEEAIQALDALNKKDISELKSYGRPPARVELVLNAVMILKKVEPTWAEAKRQLGEQNFLTSLRDFDKDHISDKTLKKVLPYTTHADFVPDVVGTVSLAAKSLCMWVLAIEKYGKIYKIVGPKKAKLDEAMASLREKQAILAEAQAKLAELQRLLDQLKRDFDEKLAQKEELRKKAEMLTLKLQRAAMLVDGLAGERIRWGETVATLDEFFDYLPGDCLLATAYVSYIGPFVTVYREFLLDLWMTAVKDEELPCSPEFDLLNFLSDPATIREWNIQGLPSDSFSTENGIIITRGSRWPLVIDPQCQAWKWIKRMEAPRGLKVVDFGTPGYLRTIEMAMKVGWPVLFQNVMEVLDPSITPILNKQIIQQGGQTMLKMGDRLVDYNKNFRFFITTKLSNPHYAPEVSTKTTLVNFAIKEEGLEAQLLGIVVRREKPQLEELKDSLVLNIAAGKRTLKDLENELLRLLTESTGSLLDNLELINTLQSSKTTSIIVNEGLQSSIITEIEIDSAREGYRGCASRASILFFVLYDMSLIDPMYQFSLDSYIAIFNNSIEKSKKTDVLEDRIRILNDYHTYAVYRNTCRGLFELHKLLFSFHMCMKILDAAGKVNQADYQFLLRGGVVLNREEQPENPCPGWITEDCWDNITELDQMAGFHGVVRSFEEFPKDWKDWYSSVSPENMPLIGEWQDICTEFQRMLFIRSLRPDRISFCISGFIVSTLGNRFVEPPVLDVKATLDDSSPVSPLIFVLSPGVDPTTALIQLAENSSMGSRFLSLSLGQGQAPIATKMIKEGVAEGLWVFLANCHLSLSWMPSLDKIIENLQGGDVHKDFRLWLSSSPHPDFPISILQNSIKMTTEPPKGLKANMKRLYFKITEEKFNECECQQKYKKLIFALVFFHSVLLERKKFQQLGWNVIYSFNDSDFDVSENLLSIYLDLYSITPWDALKYLIAGVNYGGHVTDDWDRRLLTTYINQYFTEDTISIPFHRLSGLLTYYIPKDGSLQSYRDYIVTLPNIDLPQAFGQHSNADITSLITETRDLCGTLMSLQVQATSSSGINKEDKVMQMSTDVLSKIPAMIDYELTEKNIGPKKTPLDVVLLQEIQRYNVLLKSIRISLEDVQKGIKGLVVISAELEEIFICIYEGRVPGSWLQAYPSLKPLGSWTRDMIMRVDHFSLWAATTHAPLLFWLAAYTFPTGFLTAVLQTAARQSNISIDQLSWEFTPLALQENEIVLPPSEGVYVRGMYLEGAGWDKKNLCLMEPLPMKLVCLMPVIHFRPFEQLKKRTRGIYVCPVYYYPQRCGAQGREAFVVAVDLKSGTEPSDHWVKRGTALVLSLAT